MSRRSDSHYLDMGPRTWDIPQNTAGMWVVCILLECVFVFDENTLHPVDLQEIQMK